MEIVRYRPGMEPQWDALVRGSRNGTFLLERGYVDYHRDRFEDVSLVAVEDGEWLAVLPDHLQSQSVVSHAGLTYGGWIVSFRMTAPRMQATFEALEHWLRAEGARKLLYKPVPYIYTRAPAQEDLFWLFVKGARLARRDLLSVVETKRAIPMQSRRLRGVKKAQASGIEVDGGLASLPEYWSMLERNLAERHGAKPVHTLAEMQLLSSRFPTNIRLFVARLAGAPCAGVLVYETEMAARTQYISSTADGRDRGALDMLLYELVTNIYASKPYVDLGSSMQDVGVLDMGLVEQKEGFGARSVALDTWEWQLT
jgi:hypothetical protein